MVKPVTPEVGEAGVVTVAVPATTDQAPEPEAGVLPANVAVVVLHKVWSEPAEETVGEASTEIITSSVELAQTPLDIVQRRVEEAPMVKPVTPEVGEEAVVTVAVPETTVQVPVPEAGVLAAKVAVVVLHNV